MIAIHGKADKPVYLYIDNKGCQILDADGVWGLDCHDAEEELWKRHSAPGKKRPVVAIIPFDSFYFMQNRVYYWR